MKQAFGILFQENLASWFRARGFVLVLIAALVPAGLTAAWTYTHQGDIGITDITWDPQNPQLGDTVNITATIENRFPRDAPAFDVTVEVGFFRVVDEEQRWQSRFSDTTRIDGLAADESTTVLASWEPGNNDQGTFLIRVQVDPEEELRETQRINNEHFRQLQVRAPTSITEPEDEQPTDDDNATVDENGADEEPPVDNSSLPQVDLSITRVVPDDAIYRGEQANVTVHVENRGPDALEGGNLTVRVDRLRIINVDVDGETVQAFGEWVQVRQETYPLNLTAGTDSPHRISFTPTTEGRYRVVGDLDISGVAHDEDDSGHRAEQMLEADRRIIIGDLPEGESAKQFYRGLVLDLIHLKILIPLIAVFYAAGVLTDERRKNTLPYLFTRPVPRWAIPLTRFGVSFVVAGAAVTLGILAVNAILLGQPGAQLEFLYWPLGLTLGALFVYGALFTLLGVVTRRPYLWGVLYVLGVEFLIYFGRNMLVINDRPFFQSWSEFLSLNHWFMQVFSGWDSERVVQPWLDTTSSSALVAGLGLAVIAIAALAGSAWVIRNRDFDV